MIVVKLAGGLGNQMFQYALGRINSIKYDKKLLLDLSFLLDRNQGDNFTYRDYDLDIFKLNIETVKEIHPNESFIPISEPGHHPLNLQFLNLYDHVPTDKNIYISGYFQKHEYVKDIRSNLLSDFQLVEELDEKSQKLQSNIVSTNSVCVNIRRADYVTNKNMAAFHGIYGKKYVDDGMSIINKKVKSPNVFVFSDDMEWCKDNLTFDCPHTFVGHEYKGNKFGGYLYLMSQCKHFIIPNSSFGWWAAWLSSNSDKIVITPQKWFQDPNMVTEGLKPSNWISI